MQTLKPFLRYFPRAAWIALAISLLLRVWAPEFQLFGMILSFCLIYFCSKIATFIHEAGHLIVAYWVGGTPKRMTLGWGHEMYRTTWRNIKIILKSNPMGGVAMAIFKNVPWLRARYAAYALGGLFFNMLAAALVYLLFGYRSDFIIGAQGLDVASAFIFANVVTLVNLIPFVSNFQGYPTPTDGLMFLQTIFSSPTKKIKALEFAEEYFQVFEYFEEGRYEEARELSLKLLEKAPSDVNVLSFIASIQIRELQLEEALQNLKKIEAAMNTKKLAKKRGLVFNSIAWVYLLKNDIAAAYHYATQALKLMPKNSYIEGTYGSVLVERGDIDYGIQWLMLHTSKKYINNETLSASIYLALAYHLNNDYEARDVHMEHVTQHVDKLGKDSLLLWDRCKTKIKGEAQQETLSA